MPSMRALVTDGHNSAAFQSIPVPTPASGEILVKVTHIAQNPTDWKGINGSPEGRLVGCDFSGTVADANGSQWKQGQQVAGFVHGRAANSPGLRGAFAEYLVVEASLVFAVPDGVSPSAASTIPLAYATALQALVQRLGIPDGDKKAETPFPVLISGGASSVGMYAVQIAKNAGLFVVATASKRNHDRVKALGADAVVDYNDKDWPEQVRKLTGDKLQHAFDCIAETGTLRGVAAAMSTNTGGHYVCILPRKQAELEDASSKVKVESTIVYTVFGRDLSGTAYKIFDNSGAETAAADKASWEKFLARLPEDLKSGRLVPNPVKERGGLDDLMAGFEDQKNGKVSAEKLVYTL